MKSVKIRIAVAVNTNGRWNVFGYSTGDQEEFADMALEGLDEIADGECVHWVEAEIPLPEAVTIQGKVKK